jgi:hypothetical protein
MTLTNTGGFIMTLSLILCSTIKKENFPLDMMAIGGEETLTAESA